MAEQAKVLIVGGGQAGAWVATTLRSEGFTGRITLVGAEAHPPYERPPLSKGILVGNEPRRAFLRPAADYNSLQINLRIGTEVSRVDLRSCTALLQGVERIPFDKLVLTTGSIPRRLHVPGSDLANVVYLRTMDDALTLREHLAKRPRIVVVGGGFIGLEIAAVARAMQCDVTVLEAQPGVMQRVAPPEIGAFFERAHRDRGVKIHFDTAVRHIEGNRRVERVVCHDGRRFDADLIIVAIGVVPDVSIAEATGLATDNGILVDASGRTSHHKVFAAGDVTNHPNALLGRRVRLESWQNAQNQAVAVGKTVCGKAEPYADLPWFWSDQFDLNLQMAGLPLTWDHAVVRGDMAEENFAVFYVQADHVVGISTINRPRDMSIGRRLIEQGIVIDRAKLADEQIPLKSLLK